MKRIVRSIYSRRSINVIMGVGKLQRQRHARVLAVMLVIALLVTSLPASAGTSTHPGAANPNQLSFASQVYNDAGATLASIASWVRGYVRPKPATPYEPVTAYLNPAPPFITEPTNLSVTSVSATAISLSWTPPSGGADHYQIERSENISGPFSSVGSASGATYNDTSVTNLHAYLYRVRAVSAVGAISLPSNMALGTAITFEFQVLANQIIKAQHYHDVRTAIDKVRGVAGMSGYAWARGNLSGLTINASDTNEMRSALDAALTALSIPVTAYTDATLTVNVTTIKATHLEQLQTRSTRGQSTSSGPLDPDSSSARVDPMNETGGSGENPLSRNYNWNLPLVSLPGRAGMDLNLTLSYNSLVWTKIGTSVISFDKDNGFPGPGFRLGLPVIQPLYFNTEVGKNAFLLINSDGSRTELRQVGTSALYESADSNHMLLDSSTMFLSMIDGTVMRYVLQTNGEYTCTEIKDRNGNKITVSYNSAGRIDTVTDTLGRVLTFNYDTGSLTSITQVWNQNSTAVTHYWARFEYANTPITTNFPGITIVGPANGSNLKTLSRVKLADDSYFDFTYSSWGQVYQVSNYAADAHLLNYRFYNLPQTAGQGMEHSDCPRFTQRRDWAQYWNGDTNGTPTQSEEALTQFEIPVSDTWTMPGASSSVSGTRAQVTTPDGTSNKIYFIGSPGWQRGLTALVDTFASGNSVAVRRVMTTWTQDNTSVSYPLNPRVTHTNIYDDSGNRAHTETTYDQFTFTNTTSVYLARDTFEYANDEVPPNPATTLRSTRTVYNMTTTYTDRHILGLVSEKYVYEGNVNSGGTLKSKVGFFYDESGSIDVNSPAPIQHDTAFGTSFVAGRANISSVKRFDVTGSATIITTRSKYNTSGAVVSSKDALDHEITVAYTDSFSDGVTTRNTYAYPTTLVDADGYSSTVQYHFDFGQMTRRQTPQPNQVVNTAGPVQTIAYDSIGRLDRKTNQFNGSYVRFTYAASQIQSDTYATIEDGKGEAHSFEITDGAGRVVATAMDHPEGVNRYSGQRFVYDVMGRRIKSSNATETTASGTPFQWNTSGDDATAGWIYSEQAYDWKGRPTVTTNQDLTTRTASYSGCGCAGGEVVTLTDEGTTVAGVEKRRQQKVYSDVLGRAVKSEILNWENGTVYSSKVTAYNIRDQIESVTEYAGTVGSTPQQLTSMTYDGYGRLKTRHMPEQSPGTNTVWTYNDDDTLQVITDARGATCTYVYNGRHMPTTVTHALPGESIVKSLTYDGAANRISMSHTVGGAPRDSATYQYDSLSRMLSETKHIDALAGNSMGGNYTIGYTYTLSDQLRTVTDPFNTTTNYAYDKIGRTSSVTGMFAGTNYEYAKDVTYRAWGDVKSASVFGVSETIDYNNRLFPTSFRWGSVNSTPRMRYDYTYHSDGALKEFKDLDDQIGDPHFVFFHYMSRAYSYDQAGRMASVGTLPNYGVLPPFSGSYTYDTFDNMTARSGQYALGSSRSDTGTYTNNRRSGWSYNAEGQITQSSDTSDEGGSSTRTWGYDATGVLINNSEVRNGQTTSNALGYDGDNELLIEMINSTVRNYSIRSTVLESVLTRLTATGGKDITYVNVEGLVMGLQNQNPGFSPFISAVYPDALGVQEQNSNSQYTYYAYDPLGNVIPNTQPPIVSPPPYIAFYGATWGGASWSSFSLAQNLATGCNFRGVPTDCSSAMVQTMGLDFVANLPGAHLDNALAESRYSKDVNAIFAEADQRQKQKTPPKLKKGGKKLTRKQRQKIEQKRKEDLKRMGNNESELDINVTKDGQLSPCLRDALRSFFPPVYVSGRAYSPVDEARFKSGIPGYYNIFQSNKAVTAGLYDIRYDPNLVSLSGGNFEDLKTIVEEVSHTVQFLHLWSGLKYTTGYGSAKREWATRYGLSATKGWWNNGDGYKNDVEKEAKNRVVDILGPIQSKDKDLMLCGFSLNGFLERPDW